MGWFDQMWAGINYGSDRLWGGWNYWWTTINWGDAPGWLAAFLTSGSLFLAIWILRTDKAQSRRARADKFVTWATYMGGDDSEYENFGVTFWGFNSGSQPIPRAEIITRTKNTEHVLGRLRYGSSKSPVINPNSTARYAEDFELDPSKINFLVRIVDGSGGTWIRDIETSAYLTNCQMRRFARARRRAQKKASSKFRLPSFEKR